MTFAHLLIASLILPVSAQGVRHGGQRAEVSNAQSQEAARRPEPEGDSCDFSSFRPAALRGFGGLGAPAISKPTPLYPPDAKARKIEGRVKVKVLLNIRGEVERACVLEGDPALGEAARKAALKSKFGMHWSKQMTKAARGHGEGIISYNFVLR